MFESGFSKRTRREPRLGFVEGGPTLWEDRLPLERRVADPEQVRQRSLADERRAPSPLPRTGLFSNLTFRRGCSSVVEHLVANEDVVGSSPITRSRSYHFHQLNGGNK